MQIFSENKKGTLSVFMTGELDEYSAGYIKQKLDILFAGENFERIVMDFKNLDFMDSTGIGVLISRYKQMQQRKIPIYLANPNSQMERIFKMSGLYKIMPLIS